MRGRFTKLAQWFIAFVGIVLFSAAGLFMSPEVRANSLVKVTGLSNQSLSSLVELNNASALKNAIFNIERSYRFINKQYYWVGGNGAWEDVSHWATSSGGATLHTVLPTAEDDVYFDANSFTADNQTVSLNDTANVKNITWVGVRPSRFDWNDKVLEVYGSYNRVGNASFTDGVNLIFKSNAAGNTITTNNTLFFSGSRITFNGIDGEWTLQDDLNANGFYVYLTAGTLNTNSQKVTLRRLYSTGNFSRSLILGSSELTGLDEWQVNSSLVFNSGSSIIRLNHTDASHVFAGAGFSYNQVFFNSSSTIITSANTIQSLTIASGKIVRFPANLTTTVGQLSANGDCLGYTTLESSSSQASLNINGGTTSFSGIIVKGLKALQPLTALSSFDGGNNTNWTISESSENTYYWIGGSGNWSDPAHWSTVSGGLSNGTCIPGPTDNVIFDSNSLSTGQIVTLDRTIIYVNNISGLNVSANSIFNLAGRTLSVSGSMEFSSSVAYGLNKGTIIFTSAELGERINLGNGALPNGTTVTFAGTGEYFLNSDMNIGQSGKVNLNSGRLDLNNQQLLIGSLYSTGTAPRSLELGSSAVSGLSVWSLTSTGLTFSKGSSILTFDGTSIAHTFAGAGLAYNTVVFQGTTTSVGGANSFANLTILPGKSLRIPAKSITTVGSLVMNGDCAGYTKLESTSLGTKATLSVTGLNKTFNYIAVKDINATPNTLTATNSEDGGNNSGWSINSTEAAALTYYWVGGSGNWTDSNHWATTSGGAATICNPGTNDNVIFDANSFTSSSQKVTLDQPTTYVNNITWESGVNNPIFNLNNKVLQVSGDAKLTSNMSMGTVKGTLIFDSKNQLTNIDLGGLSLVNGTIATFNGSSNYILKSKLDLGIGGRINLNSGTLSTNNEELTTGLFYSTSNSARALNLGGSTVIGLSIWSVTASNFNLEAGNSFLNFNSSAAAHTFTGGGKLYNNVSFNGTTTTLNNSNTFKVVTVAGGKTLNLQSGQKQTMEELVTSSVAPITTLKSSSTASSALEISSEEFCSDYLAIQNVTVSGTAIFYAGTNSTLSGTTTGWNASGCEIVYAPDSEAAKNICNNTESIISTGTNQWQELRYDGKLVAAIKDGGNALGEVHVLFTITTNNSRNGENANIAPRNWTIISENQPAEGNPVSVRFYGMLEEFDAYKNENASTVESLSDLSITKYSSDSEDCSYENSYSSKGTVAFFKNPTYTIKGNYFIAELPVVSSFSEFYMHNGATELEFPAEPEPLPVELVNFSATPTAAGAILTWQTASEQNNAYFEVQSTNNLKSGEFKTLGRVNTKDGNSNILLSYEFLDATAAKGTTVYYRLKQVDTDGPFEYSKVVTVNIKQAAKGKGLVNAYPNPFKDKINLEVEADKAGEMVATLYDARGYKVFARSISVAAGTSSVLVELPTNLRTGLYFLTTQVDGNTKTTRLIKD